MSRSGKQWDTRLSLLAGREKEFVADLEQLAVLIEKTAPAATS